MVVLSHTFAKGGRAGNGGDRGNSKQRRARKWHLLRLWGDGETCPCLYCGKTLDFATLEADRVKPGSAGGSYRRENVIPACKQCNVLRGDKSLWTFDRNLARRLTRRGYDCGFRHA